MKRNWFSIWSTSIVIVFICCASSCNKEPEPVDQSKILTIKTSEIINPSFIGNGAQWGGYDLLRDWTGKDDFSENDWAKLAARVDYMRPPLVRIMVDGNWSYIKNNTYDNSKTTRALLRILDYCEENDITVMFGEWGHKYLNDDRNQINEQWLSWNANYIEWLVTDKGYSCIKYFNMEPYILKLTICHASPLRLA